MNDPIQFDKGSVVQLMPDSVAVMAEIYCDAQGPADKSFPIAGLAEGESVLVDAVSGTLSFQGLNWSWWRKLWRPGTALCGWIGSSTSWLLSFDIQGDGTPQLVPYSATFPGGVELDAVRFQLYADLALPTDFRAALAFHRQPDCTPRNTGAAVL